MRASTWSLLGYKRVFRLVLSNQEFIWPFFCQLLKNPASGSVQNRMVVWQFPFKIWMPGENYPWIKPLFKRPLKPFLALTRPLAHVSKRPEATMVSLNSVKISEAQVYDNHVYPTSSPQSCASPIHWHMLLSSYFMTWTTGKMKPHALKRP